MLKASNLSIEFSKLLFKDVSFMLGNREKVGLVGLNGSGKSTLLKIIAGLEKADTGSIELVNEKLSYLPQEFDLTEEGNLVYLGEYKEKIVQHDLGEVWRVNKILNILNFAEVDDFAEIASFSPGQKMKLYLAKLLIDEPSILLLDEPTNHLDLGGIEWFEKFVKNFDGICIIISHDREFLNNVCDTIFEIDSQKLNTYTGNYDDYVIERAHRQELYESEYRAQEKKRERLENLIVLIRKQSSGKKQSKKLSSAKKRLEREVTNVEIEKYKKVKLGDFELSGSVHDKKKVLTIKNLSFAYPDKDNILKDVNLEMFGSERIWIKGDNGTGKSTFIKLITSELHPKEGAILWGQNVRWKYFAQDHDPLQTNDTVQEYFTREAKMLWDRSFGVLSKFLFDKDLRNNPVRTLSPGQKSRLRFAIFAQQEYECLILDEPTNHLDIETKEVIEDSLREFRGSIILVSHDRYFAEQILPNRIMTIESKRLVEI